MTDITAPRLTLRPMGPEVVEAALAGDLVAAARALGATIPPALLDRPRTLHYARLRLEEDPRYAPWGPRAMLLDGAMIGHLRFHSRPDPVDLHPWARGAVEFGYGVFPDHRGRGFATEAARAAMGWALAEHAVRHFVLTISPDNAASLAVAARLDFGQVGEQMDEEDGRELVLLRELPGGPAVRGVAPEEIGDVRALLVETWHDTYDGIMGAHRVAAITGSWHTEDRLAAQAAQPDAAFLVALLGGAVVGHAFAVPGADGPARLQRLYVRPGSQRHGIGTALLAAVAARFPGRMVLDVAAGNAKGRAFYARHGFRVTGEHHEDGIHHLVMGLG